MNDEARMTKRKVLHWSFGFRHSSLIRHSDFGFRHLFVVTRTASLLVALAISVIAGCGEGGDQATAPVPVSGTVTFEGQPVAGAYVAFRPEGKTRGGGGRAITDASGKYELKSPDGRLGAPVGNYRVIVTNEVTPMMGEYSPPPTTSPEARLKLPAVYGDMQRSPLRATVPEEGGTVDLDLTSRP